MGYEVKIGDKVRCIEECFDDCKNNSITKYKIYEITHTTDSDCVGIVNDMGFVTEVFKERFEKVTEETLSQIIDKQFTDLGNRLQKAESIIKEYIEYKRLNKQQWSHELQKYVEEYCDINFTKE